jgi:hypothetical protein
MRTTRGLSRLAAACASRPKRRTRLGFFKYAVDMSLIAT